MAIRLDRARIFAAEKAIRDLAHPAAVIHGDFTILAANRHYKRRFGNGSGVAGRHCFEASHGYSKPCEEMGERCPLRSALNERDAVEAVHAHYTARGREIESVVVRPLEEVDGLEGAFLEVLYPPSQCDRELTPLIGRSRSFLRMMELVRRVACSELPVLILGESGTGKEMIAREIHQQSQRHRQNFVPVDCSGLAETLFESELFGHEQGAFTGATRPKKGLAEVAEGGTLFLDEIGDVPLSQQVKLLRLLETGLYRRVGSVEMRWVNFRLVCATHRDLRAKIEEGTFREDLIHRINIFPIEVPPLRQRKRDLGLIAQGLLRRIDPRNRRRLDPAALLALERYNFPGNVREMLNILQRASLLADGPVILLEHLPEEIRRKQSQALGGIEFPEEILTLDQMKAYYVQSVALHFQGSRRELARKLGISERSLHRKLAEGASESCVDWEGEKRLSS